MNSKELLDIIRKESRRSSKSDSIQSIEEGIFNTDTMLQILDSVPNPVYFKGIDKVFKVCNTSFFNFLDIDPSNFFGESAINSKLFSIYDILEREYALIHDEIDNQVLKNHKGYEYEAVIKTNLGCFKNVLINKVPMFDRDGNITGIAATMTDISYRVEMERKLEKLMKMKDAMLEVNQEALGNVELKGLMNWILNKIISVMGDKYLGTVMKVDGDKVKFFTSHGYEECETGDYDFDLEDSFYYRSGGQNEPILVADVESLGITAKFPSDDEGNECVVKSVITTPIMIDGKISYFINIDSLSFDSFSELDLELMKFVKGQVEIVIKNRILYDEIVNISRYDKLTNIFNRRYFEDHFSSILIKARRYDESFSMVIFDLNGLKATNDKYGHLAGDNVIKGFANLISSSIRASDIFARFGGDEFIGIFFESDISMLKIKFEDMLRNRNLIKIPFEGDTIDISFSYGIAQYPQDGTTYEDLFNIADERMYVYKHSEL